MKIEISDENRAKLYILRDKLKKDAVTRQEVYDFLDDLHDDLATAFSDYYKENGESISQLEAGLHAQAFIAARKKEFKGVKRWH